MSNNQNMTTVALITGASSGLGRATALLLAEKGISVALVARRGDLLEQLQQEIQQAGGIAEYYVTDVADEANAAAASQWALSTFGYVDILVNNAGIIRPGTVVDQSPDEWRETFNINMLAPMYLSQNLLPVMRERGKGHIVNVSSNAAKMAGGMGQSAYGMSKHALNVLSSSLRKENQAFGIRVTVIEPGTTTSDIAASITDEARREVMTKHMTQETNMEPEDIAAAIYYTISQPERVNVSEIWITPTRGAVV